MKQISTRVSESDKIKIQQLAKENDMSVNDYLLHMALSSNPDNKQIENNCKNLTAKLEPTLSICSSSNKHLRLVRDVYSNLKRPVKLATVFSVPEGTKTTPVGQGLVFSTDLVHVDGNYYQPISAYKHLESKYLEVLEEIIQLCSQ